MVCQEHKIGFTLYPPGYYPYSRHILAPVSPDGKLLVEPTDQHRFSGTLFDASLDASVENIWPKETVEGSMQPRLTTQNRHLERIARLFGIGVNGNSRQREEVSQILMISGQLLHDCAASWQDVFSPRNKGTVICKILGAIPFFVNIFERLTEIGSGAELWPSPLFCTPDSLLRPTRFHTVRTRGAPEKKRG